MKTLLLSLLFLPLSCLAQDADPLAVTLPTGKVVHFQTAEQRDKFLAAQARAQGMVIATPTPAPVHFGGTALDAGSLSTGKVEGPTSEAATQTGSTATIKGKVISVDEAAGVLIVDSHSARTIGAESVSGIVALSVGALASKINDGDRVDATGREAGSYRYVTALGAAKKVRSFTYSGGYFKTEAGKLIK